MESLSGFYSNHRSQGAMGFKKEIKQPNFLVVGYVKSLSLDYSLIFFVHIFYAKKKKSTAEGEIKTQN